MRMNDGTRGPWPVCGSRPGRGRQSAHATIAGRALDLAGRSKNALTADQGAGFRSEKSIKSKTWILCAALSLSDARVSFI